MTGLMYHKPEDHINYMLDCLGKVKDKKGPDGPNGVKWNTFVGASKTSPLPPIGSDKDKEPVFHHAGEFETS